MISCAPKGHQVALTANALIYLCKLPEREFVNLASMFDKVWVHWPTVVEMLKEKYIEGNTEVRTILNLWDGDAILELPGDAELPAIAALNNTPGYEDNVSVYCATFGEYVELRKTYGQEDITYFRRT